jgi:uncharacterized protein (DUF58 family)
MRRLLRPAIVVLAIAVVTRVDPVLGIAMLLALWAWIGWRTPPLALEQLAGERAHADVVMFGDRVHLELRVVAGRALPWVQLTDMVPFQLGENVRWVTSLGAGKASTHAAEFAASARGLHRLGPTLAVTGDTFGLRRVQSTLIPASRLLVYPRIVALDTLAVAAGAPLPLIPVRTPLYDDPTRVVGVREYEPGDQFRTIHWTATAAAGDLLVKKYRPAIARDVMIALDLTRASHPLPGRRRSAELGVTAAASIAHHLVTIRREAVGLRLVGRDTPTGEDTASELTPGRDERRLMRLLERLARADVTGSTVSDRLLDPAGLGFGTSVVFVTGILERRHVLDVIRLKRVGIDVTVVLTAGSQHRGAWEAEMREMHVPVRSVSRLAEMVDL